MPFSQCSDHRVILTGAPSGCDASSCHKATPLGQYPPQSGKHSQHLNSSGSINCSDCHSSYDNHQLHKNGILNGYNSVLQAEADGDIIFFKNTLNPNASWDNSTGTCSDMSCHGNVDWNTTTSMGCTLCHAPGSTYDPLSKGKHSKHLNTQHAVINNIGCEICHFNYYTADTHKNGQLDTGATANIVQFDSSKYVGTWSYSTCQSLDCHGNAGWFTATELACGVCHDVAYSAYYPVPRGQGGHTSHLDDHACVCGTCHYNYQGLSTHIDGTNDTLPYGVGTINLIIFDNDYKLLWDNNTGSCERTETGGCHGGSTHNWYSPPLL